MSDPSSRRVDLDSVLSLLRSEDSELAAASAMVLGACAPSTPQVLGELLARIESASSSLKPYLIEALAKIDPAASFPTVARFLVTSGPLREQAVRLLADRGQAALANLRSLAERTGDGDIAAVIRAIAAIPRAGGPGDSPRTLAGREFRTCEGVGPSTGGAHRSRDPPGTGGCEPDSPEASRPHRAETPSDRNRCPAQTLGRSSLTGRGTGVSVAGRSLDTTRKSVATPDWTSPLTVALARRHNLLRPVRLAAPLPRGSGSGPSVCRHPLLGRFGAEGVSLEELALQVS